MSGKRYPEEFQLAAVRQITEGGYAVSEVARRLNVIVDVVKICNTLPSN